MKQKHHYEQIKPNIYVKVVDGDRERGTYTFYPANRTMVKNN